jgi:hypothetical protein
MQSEREAWTGEDLDRFLGRIEAEQDARRLQDEAGKAAADLAAAERCSVPHAVRLGAALRRLKTVTPGTYMVAVRSVLGRSHRSATNYAMLASAYDTSPEARAAVLAAPSIRRALAVVARLRREAGLEKRRSTAR